MRLEIRIDAVSHVIDSTDPVTLGRWIVEIFGRATPTPATWYQVYAQSSYSPDGKQDWITGGYPLQPKTPRELVEGLARELDEIERNQR